MAAVKATTIFEISKILNISTSTVSRALKNHPDISPQTKSRVLETARKLNYEPNLFAVSLRAAKSREIAIIAPVLSGFFYESFISAVEAESKSLGYTVITLLSGDDPEIEIQNIKMCKQRRVACVMLCVTSKTIDYAVFHSLQSSGVPIIFFDKVPTNSDFVSVCADDRAAASLAAKALIRKSKKNVLSIFGDNNFSITKNRLDAYRQVFTRKDITNGYELVHATNSKQAEEWVIRAFESIANPDAVFCMSDEILIGVMKAVQIKKLLVPRQVSIIAISNGFFPTLYYPEITYIETSGYKLGSMAMNKFLQVVNENTLQRSELLQPVYVQGGSL